MNLDRVEDDGGQTVKTPCVHQCSEGCYLQVPAACSSDLSSSLSVSPVFSILSADSLPNSPTSSEEDLSDTNAQKVINTTKQFYSQNGCERRKSLDCEGHREIHQKVERKISLKEHKTAWSKVKEIIHQTKVAGIKRKHVGDEATDGVRYGCIERSDNFPTSLLPSAPTLTVTLPSTERLHDPSTSESSSAKRMATGEVSPPLPRKSTWFRVKKVFLSSPQGTRSAPASPIRTESFLYDVESDDMSSIECVEDGRKDEQEENLDEEIRRNYLELQMKLREEFEQKCAEWESSGTVVGRSGVSSGTSSLEGEGERRDFNDPVEGPRYVHRTESNITSDFKKKLEEWDRLKSGCALDPPNAKKRISDWYGWKRAMGKGPNDTKHDVQGQITPKRLLQIECIRAGVFGEFRAGQPAKTRIKSNELAWLEKELLKMEKEKRRLDREKEKYLQREARLRKMKLSLRSGVGKQEILIPTSTGTMRFHGISRQFTQRLYEWEKAQGIEPEASTFALLEPGYKPSLGNQQQVCSMVEHGTHLIRSKSISSVADLSNGSCSQAAILAHHPSSLSLNDVDHLEQVCFQSPEEEISTPFSDSTDLKDNICSEEGDFVPRTTYSPDEVTRLIDSSGSECEMEHKSLLRAHGQDMDSHNCYNTPYSLADEPPSQMDGHLKIYSSDVDELGELERLEPYRSLDRVCPEESRCFRQRCRDDILHRAEAARHCYSPDEDSEGSQRPIRDLRNELFILKKKDTIIIIHELVTELLHLAERLESALCGKNNEPWSLARSAPCEHLDKIHDWYSSSRFFSESECRGHQPSMDDITTLPRLMTSKVLQLRGFLSNISDDYKPQGALCMSHDMPPRVVFEEPSSEQSIDEELHETHCIEDHECSSSASSFTYHPAVFAQPKCYISSLTDSDSNIDSLRKMLENESTTSTVPRVSEPIRSMNGALQGYSHNEKSLSHCFKSTSRSANDETKANSNVSTSNVFVPTIRKIFSPVFMNDEESPVIGVIVEEQREDFEDSDCSSDGKGTMELLEVSQSDVAPLAHVSSASEGEDMDRRSERSPDVNVDHLNDSCSKLNLNDNGSVSSQSSISVDGEDEKAEKISPIRVIGVPPMSPPNNRRQFKRDTSGTPRLTLSARFGDLESSPGKPPVIWRSPQADRRVRPFERYLGGVQKSSSATVLRQYESAENLGQHQIWKSSSAGALKSEDSNSCGNSSTTVSINADESDLSTSERLRLRALKIKRAKEEFLSGVLNDDCTPSVTVSVHESSPTIEVGEEQLLETSKLLLVKSASEGTVGAERDKNVEPSKKSKSRIASWLGLRKKPTESVSKPCRQSLLVEVGRDSELEDINSSEIEPSRSCPSSPQLSGKHSWIRNPARKIFRPKGKYTINNK